MNRIKQNIFPQSRPCQSSLAILFGTSMDFLDEVNVVFTNKMKLDISSLRKTIAIQNNWVAIMNNASSTVYSTVDSW